MLKSKFKGNTIALGIFELADNGENDQPIERDASGIPVAWRLFRLGANSITQGGQNIILDFTSEIFDMIIGYFLEKGEKIPLDSKHFLFHLAEKFGVEESELLNFLPDGMGTFGFGSLEKRPDGLWIRDVEYVPIARQLMAEHILQYFSPVLRGLLDGRYRITSVTFENEPALNNLDAIAASAECSTGILPVSVFELQGKLDALAASADIRRNNQQKEKEVNKLLIALAGLLGMDSISLGADKDAPEGVIEKITNLKTEVTGLKALKQKVSDFTGALKDKLALGADADLNAVQGRILGLIEKAGQADQYKARADALELSAENEKRVKLIEQGKAEGKLSNKMIAGEWLKNMDSVALAAFLKDQDVVIPPGQINPETLGNPDAIAMSAADDQVCLQLGISKEKFLATKKALAK